MRLKSTRRTTAKPAWPAANETALGAYDASRTVTGNTVPDACVLDGELLGRLDRRTGGPRDVIRPRNVEIVEVRGGGTAREQRVARDLPGGIRARADSERGSSAARSVSSSGILGNSRIRRT